VFFLSLIGFIPPQPSPAATIAQIDLALEKARQFIYSRQNKEGNWESVSAPERIGNWQKGSVDGAQWGGLTAMAVYALVASGESPADPRLARALTFLRNAHLVGTYALAMRCEAWSVLPQDPVNRLRAKADADALLHGMITGSPGRGFYTYTVDANEFPIPGWRFDLSNSQMAVLGVWAADQACYPNGAQIPLEYWQIVDDAWRRAQLNSGGWPYVPLRTGAGGLFNNQERASMTAAGVATLYITDDYLHRDAGLICQDHYTDSVLEDGLTQASGLFTSQLSATPDDRYGYTLYAFERIGAASGQRYLQKVDWFDKGADFLLSRQSAVGSWGPEEPALIGRGNRADFAQNPFAMPNTCFSMVFLARGRAPSAIGKIQYGQNAAWDQRPRDAANLTRWIGYQTEKYLNWQVIGLTDPINDLHDSAMLYLAGSGPVDLSDNEVARLKQYIEEGGILVGNADCGSTIFAASFEALGKKMFPAYDFRNLGAGSLLQSGEIFKPRPGRQTTALRALSNGVRELMILIPASDPSKYWQGQQVVQRPEEFEVMENILVYATDKLGGLHMRGRGGYPQVDKTVKARGDLYVARLQFPGNWDPEPAGWRRMTALLHNEKTVDLDVRTVDLSEGRIEPGFDLAVLTGTGGFVLSDVARRAISNYIASGGTVVIDAAGGDGQFADSAEKELAQLLPGIDPAVPAWDDPSLPIGYRNFARRVVGQTKSARLRGYSINGRLAVIYSPDDLSAGLVGEEMDGIRGYDPATATALMKKIVIAVQEIRRPVPTTRPVTRPTTLPTTRQMTRPTTKP
jgi:hypothetical protein